MRVPVMAPLPAATLGAVFGRDHVVHVAVAPGRLATALRMECHRLASLRGEATEENDDTRDDQNDDPLGDGAKADDRAADGNGRIGA